MSFQRLQPGDRISHPNYGLDVVEGTTTFNQNGQATEFYSARLDKDRLLTVPVLPHAGLDGRRLARQRSSRCIEGYQNELAASSMHRPGEHSRATAGSRIGWRR